MEECKDGRGLPTARFDRNEWHVVSATGHPLEELIVEARDWQSVSPTFATGRRFRHFFGFFGPESRINKGR